MVVQELKERFQREAKILADGIIKVDSFLNHQIDCNLMWRIGAEIARRFQRDRVSKILTAEASGIPAALTTGIHLSVPVIYARKRQPVTMVNGCYRRLVVSPTKKSKTELVISSECLSHSDRILVVDDFVASGETTLALLSMVKEAAATLIGVAAVINKRYSGGEAKIAAQGIKIETLVSIIDIREGKFILE